MKVKIEIDGAAAEPAADASTNAPSPPQAVPPEHVLARAAATGALNAGPAPTVPQSPGDLAPAASHAAVPPPSPAAPAQSAGAGPGQPAGENVGVVEQS